MRKSWNDSELARLSAYLDRRLAATLDQLELGDALKREADQETGGRPAGGPWAENENPEAGLKDETEEAAPAPESPVPGLAVTEDDWLEPELLGEPEVSVGLDPEVVRELSRMIEAAVEKGVAAALARIKG